MDRPADQVVDAKDSSVTERTFRLVLEYDGTDFEGWQTQSGERAARTVQGTLEQALTELARGPVRLRGAGRTDSGVHAMGQVASARFVGRLGAQDLLRALNGRLPGDLSVLAVDEVPADWDALREARGKHYRYQIWNGRLRSPLRARRWTWLAEELDLEAMALAAREFVGRHDFAAFQGAGSPTKTTVRLVESFEIEGRAGHEIRMDVRGEGFLRHMVRNLAGTLIEVGRGRWSLAEVREILASRDRARAGPTAPAVGLSLVAVRDSWSERASAVGSVDAGGPVG